MERYKDRDHAFLVGMLFFLMFLWLSAFVCRRFCVTVLLSVCVHQCPAAWACVFLWAVSVRVLVSYIVCELPSLPAQCALEAVVVLCWLGLPSPISSWFVLSGSVCVLPISLFFGYSVRSFFALFLHSSKASHVPVFSHANANKAQQFTFERFTTAALPVLSKEHTA